MTDAATLNALAYLYIAFGHATDDSLSTEEMRTLAGHLQSWAPDQTLEQIGTALREGMSAYQQRPSRREKIARALELAKQLASHLPDDQLPKIHQDLAAIAEADGEVSDEETKMMDAIAKVMHAAKQ